MQHEAEIREILHRVDVWPDEERVALAYQILRDMRIRYRAQPPLSTLDRALGIANVDGRTPPDDETVSKWIDEHRMRKYGG